MGGVSNIRSCHGDCRPDPRAQVRLGRFFALGWGVRKDYIEAYMWFLVALRQGPQTEVRTQYAWDSIGELAGRMTVIQISEAKALADRWRPIDSVELP